MKNNIDYFSHDAHSYQHNKFKMLRVEYWWEWYWKFWALNEIIAQAENCELDLTQKYNKASVASDLWLKISELDEFITFLVEECNLLVIIDWLITTDRVQEVLEKVMKDRKRMKKNYEDNTKTKWRHHEESKILREENIQSKVKESKVNKTKVNNISSDIVIATKVATNNLQELIKDTFDSEFINNLNDKYNLWQEDFKEQCNLFYIHRSEKKPNGKKELWEMQKTFDPKLRFYKWLSNNKKWSNKEKTKISNITF